MFIADVQGRFVAQKEQSGKQETQTQRWSLDSENRLLLPALERWSNNGERIVYFMLLSWNYNV